MDSSDSIIAMLQETLARDERVALLLEHSVGESRGRSHHDLDHGDEAFKWPAELAEYEAYLRRFVRRVPSSRTQTPGVTRGPPGR